MLFPQLVPVPDTGGQLAGNAVTELVRKHQDLSAMMGVMGKHIGEHGCSRRPGTKPTAGEFFDLPVRSARKRICEHAQALRRAAPVGSGGLLHGAAARIERSRASEVRCVAPEPDQTAVVQVSKNGGDGSVALRASSRAASRQPCAPGLRI